MILSIIDKSKIQYFLTRVVALIIFHLVAMFAVEGRIGPCFAEALAAFD